MKVGSNWFSLAHRRRILDIELVTVRNFLPCKREKGSGMRQSIGGKTGCNMRRERTRFDRSQSFSPPHWSNEINHSCLFVIKIDGRSPQVTANELFLVNALILVCAMENWPNSCRLRGSCTGRNCNCRIPNCWPMINLAETLEQQYGVFFLINKCQFRFGFTCF